MIKIICCTSLLLILPTWAFAKCPTPQKTVFECTTTQKKIVQVCDAGTTLSYKFGKSLAKPELQLKVARQKATTYQWNGIGPTESYTVNIPNGNTTYSVFSILDKNNFKSTSGISVYQNKKEIATLYCDAQYLVIEDLFDIDLPAEK